MAESNTIIDRSKYEYGTVRVADPKTGKVRNSTSNGDSVARALLAIPFDDLMKVAKKNGIEDTIAKHVNNLNPGQVRMITGNALRAKVRKGEEVIIGDVVVKKLDQREPVIKEAPLKAAEPKKKAKKAA